MNNLVMWNLVIGFLLPTLISVLQQPRFSQTVRSLITAVVCVLGGLGTAYFNDQFNTGDVVGSILITMVAAITFYKGFWKPTGVAPSIEDATSTNERGETDAVRLLVIAILVIAFIFVLVEYLLPALR